MNRLGSFPVSPGHINPPVILGPNITGYFGSVTKGNINSSNVQPIATGAFIDVGSIGSKTYFADASNETYWRGTNFSASNSNENFGNSDSIQPSSGYALTIIKA